MAPAERNAGGRPVPVPRSGERNVPRSAAGSLPSVLRPSLLRPVFMRAGIVEEQRRYTVQRHQHTRYEVIFVDRGTYRCLHNEIAVRLKRNALLVIKPGDWHSDVYDGRPVRFFGMGFELQMAEGLPLSIFREGAPTARQNFVVSRRDFLPVITKIIRESQTPDLVSGHLQDTLILEFFYRMVRAVPRDVLSPYFLEASREASFAATLLALLNGQLTRCLPLADLAARLGMSESSLAHKTRTIMGQSPARLFLGLKMERAMQMLLSTDMSVKEIGAYLGFDDQAHFSRAFKKTYRSPPSAVRANPSPWRVRL
ncbi:MAG: AraC family transcriptional regulator [Kiritimatiellae bacterium]|nr:AraC family transcriptional regulator [Kiritimatiellia bacterium]